MHIKRLLCPDISGMRVALAQKLHIHTEIVGAFGALCQQLGLPFCIYYDVGDPMDMIPYILPEYEHKTLRELFHGERNWDVLVLVTSDEWREPHERAFTFSCFLLLFPYPRGFAQFIAIPTQII